jgi:hypothetical protein
LVFLAVAVFVVEVVLLFGLLAVRANLAAPTAATTVVGFGSEIHSWACFVSHVVFLGVVGVGMTSGVARQVDTR